MDEITSTLKNILTSKQEMLLLLSVKRIGLKIPEVIGGKIIGGFKHTCVAKPFDF